MGGAVLVVVAVGEGVEDGEDVGEGCAGLLDEFLRRQR